MQAALHPWAALGLAALLTIGAVVGMPRIDAQVDFVDTVPDHPGLEPYRELVERLDGVRFVSIYMAHDEGHGSPSLRDPDGFDALVQDQGDLSAWMEQQFPGVFSHSLSVWEGMRQGHYMLEKIATGGNPRPESYSVPEDPARYQAVRDRALSDGSLDDVLAQDGSSSLALFFFATDDNQEARALAGEVMDALPQWQSPTGVTQDHQASGLLVASHVTDEQNRRDVPLWGGIAMGAVALSLLWAVRRPGNVVIALACTGAATVWTFGSLGWFGIELSFLSVFLAPVVIGIGIDHAVHVLHRIEETGDAARGTRDVGQAVLVAGGTTAAGLAVLLFVPAPLFAEIGGVAALGILFSVLAAFLIAPAARALLRPRPARRQDRIGPALARWARRARTSPVPIIFVVALTIAAVAVGATQTRLESGSSENEFPQDDPLIVLQQRIEEEYGAFQRAYIVVRGDMTDPLALRSLHEMSSAASSLPLFREASSIADILLADEATDQGAADIALASILDGTGQRPTDAERLPQTRAEARQALDRVHQDPLWGSIAPFTITSTYDLAIVAIQVDPWQSQEELEALRDALVDLQDQFDPRLPQHEVRAAGSPVNRAAIIDQTPMDVAIATLGSTAVVTGILAIAWSRRGLEGLKMAAIGGAMVLVAAAWLIAAVPLLDATYKVLGTANNAALNDMFLLAFAITVAVGVDDLVHVTSRYWQARDAGARRGAALDEAFAHAGRAITGTTLTTFAAFAVMSGVYFLQSKNLAILTATGVVATYALTLMLLPRALAGRPATRRD